MFSRTVLAALALLAAACASAPPAPRPAPITTSLTITLTGTVTRADYPSYLELPFTVPPGVKRLTLNLAYEHRGDGVTLDMGLRDPDGQRGWSGSNKSDVVLSAWQATRSYRSGPIVPGEWALILGVPNVREGRVSDYTATITLDPELIGDSALAAASFVVNEGGPGWLRGDFHSHTGHSDGSCALHAAAARAPCPTLMTLSAADANASDLDFIAFADHNTLTQIDDIADLQSTTETILIPGTEITTFEGHANVFGIIEPLDFQLGTTRLPDIDALLDEVDRRGALLAINHPGLPTGESCMGCGWTAETDWSRIEAMEVVNGSLFQRGGEEGEYSGVPFWENLLDQGHRIAAIAGSDNHDPADRTGEQPPIGAVTTRVFVKDRSTLGVIEGVRSGRAVVDLLARDMGDADLRFHQDGRDVFMGGELKLGEGETANGFLTIDPSVFAGRVELVAYSVDADLLDADVLDGATEIPITITGLGKRGWFRFNIRDANTGRLLMLGNPIYIVPAD